MKSLLEKDNNLAACAKQTEWEVYHDNRSLMKQLNTDFICHLRCVSVALDRPRWQKEADGLRLSDDGCHHVYAYHHAVL